MTKNREPGDMVALGAVGTGGLAGMSRQGGARMALGGLLRQRMTRQRWCLRVVACWSGQGGPGSPGLFVPDSDLRGPHQVVLPRGPPSVPILTLDGRVMPHHSAPAVFPPGRPASCLGASGQTASVCFGAFTSVSVFLPGDPTG